LEFSKLNLFWKFKAFSFGWQGFLSEIPLGYQSLSQDFSLVLKKNIGLVPVLIPVKRSVLKFEYCSASRLAECE